MAARSRPPARCPGVLHFQKNKGGRNQSVALTHIALFINLLECHGNDYILPARCAFGVINRGLTRRPIFHKDEDYLAVARVMVEAFGRGHVPSPRRSEL